MGLIGRLLGGGIASVGGAVVDVAETFRPNATKQMELQHEAYQAALEAHSTEFQYGRVGLFDSVMNGLNRMPRPMLALGTLGLFVYAMIDPVAFAERMQGLAFVPEPLWWLLGAIVSFYFGARELHYRRVSIPPAPTRPQAAISEPAEPQNPALQAWRASRSGKTEK